MPIRQKVLLVLGESFVRCRICDSLGSANFEFPATLTSFARSEAARKMSAWGQANLRLPLPINVVKEAFAILLGQLVDVVDDVAVVFGIDHQLAVVAKFHALALRPTHHEL